MQKKLNTSLDYVQIRSILINNSEAILEYLNSKKQQAKNNSTDIFSFFGDGDEASRLNWNLNLPTKTKLEVLQEEKNSLGVYMSGNPLENFISLLELIRTSTGIEKDLHICVLDKVKKVFTRANAMMFALQLTTTEFEIEGVIFSKKALAYSPILEEGKLYWVIGNIDEGSKKTKAEPEGDEATKFAETNIESVEITEYVEKPKILISHIGYFDEGFVSFLKGFEQPPSEEFETNFPTLEWQEFKSKPLISEKLKGEITALAGLYKYKPKKGRSSNSSNGEFKPNEGYKKFLENKMKSSENNKEEKANTIPKKVKVTLYKSLGSKIVSIKAALITSPKDGYTEVELYVETQTGQIKKVKGSHYLPSETLFKE